MWQDRRTADICRRLQGRGPRGAGHRADRAAPRPVLLRHQAASGSPRTSRTPGRSSRTAATPIGTVDSYLVARMTRGTWHVTDVSNACRTLLFDLAEGDWSDELCDLFGVPARRAARGRARRGARSRRTDPKSFLGLELPDLRHPRRPAVGAVRSDLLRGRRHQVHLRHRVVHPHQHRHRGRALRRGAAVDGGLAVPRRRARPTPSRAPSSSPARPCSGCATGCRSSARRPRPRRSPATRRQQRRRGVRAGADRSRRPRLGPARPRHHPRHHPRHDPGAHRPRDAGGDRLRGPRRHRHPPRRLAAPLASPSTAARPPTTCSASCRPTSSAYRWSGRRSSRRPASGAAFVAGPRRRRLVVARGARRDLARSTGASSRRPTATPADAAHRQWRRAVERAKGWAE